MFIFSSICYYPDFLWLIFMLKKLIGLLLFCILGDAGAQEVINLYRAPLSRLNHFSLTAKSKKILHAHRASSVNDTSLNEVNLTRKNSRIFTRYQQMYHGLAVVGAQIVVSKEANQSSDDKAVVNGRVLDNVQLDTQPQLTPQQALDVAEKSWLHFNPATPINEVRSELQIREKKDNELTLVYLISFKSTEENTKPAWPFFIVDARSGELIEQWNNIKNFADSGPGGNEKMNEYWYGKDGLPALEVAQNGAECIMESTKVKLVNLGFAWDWYNLLASPSHYPCGKNEEERINGAFSTANDAYYFGHIIVDMYKEWYGVNALQQVDGTPAQLVMRVHFGQGYDNAFWDGQYMSFGDGRDLYPLVSLDIAGHEVTHGFTEQHANLEYHDQSGALNESLSDMAGQAARAYMLEKFPLLYNKIYPEPNVVTWGIGETVVREPYGKALRFMDSPASDGSSAECYDKEIAQNNGVYCPISYADVLKQANNFNYSPQQRQSFIVHTASGIFNKLFYLLSQKIGIKQAYHVMIIANSTYWTSTTDMMQGACGVLYGARDLSIDLNVVKPIFLQVGIDAASCTY